MLNFSRSATIILILFLVFNTSCKEDDPQIIGTWNCSEGYTEECGERSGSFDTDCEGFEVDFLSDGTYTTRLETNGNVYENEGTYVIAEDFLIINLESGRENADRFTLSSNELQIIKEQGQGCKLIWVYTKE